VPCGAAPCAAVMKGHADCVGMPAALMAVRQYMAGHCQALPWHFPGREATRGLSYHIHVGLLVTSAVLPPDIVTRADGG
jgi:hypothetical protein